mmetsp:Transcript_3467/g.10716  ORF Transcript_3467/g.10716 Transcript_3467/m.10716 type:complete len:275 (+) Transcript_3467:937-1761(+)
MCLSRSAVAAWNSGSFLSAAAMSPSDMSAPAPRDSEAAALFVCKNSATRARSASMTLATCLCRISTHSASFSLRIATSCFVSPALVALAYETRSRASPETSSMSWTRAWYVYSWRSGVAGSSALSRMRSVARAPRDDSPRSVSRTAAATARARSFEARNRMAQSASPSVAHTVASFLAASTSAAVSREVGCGATQNASGEASVKAWRSTARKCRFSSASDLSRLASSGVLPRTDICDALSPDRKKQCASAYGASLRPFQSAAIARTDLSLAAAT